MKLSFIFINSNLDEFIIIVISCTFTIPISINLELNKKNDNLAVFIVLLNFS